MKLASVNSDDTNISRRRATSERERANLDVEDGEPVEDEPKWHVARENERGRWEGELQDSEESLRR